ncbi:MAG: hypothetical protein KF793_16605, partial [Nitrospira sp.]|nr:hypothetical protein [Nitrospira sp.]
MRVPSTVTVWMIGVLVLLGIAPPRHALSQAVIPFHIVGHIQRLTLDSPADPLSGAKLTVNGVEVVLPKNLVIQLPAAYFTAQQLFDKAQGVSKKYGESGLALSDKFPPLAAFEADVSGNIVNGLYIAGLVTISQQSLNTGAGFIHHIDTATGMMCVGGSPTAAACAGNDTRIRLNDPALDASDPFAGDGRYGKPNPAPPPVGLDDPNSRYPDP